jgi:hypothetical protein
MPTVIIGGETFEVYEDVAAIDAYMEGSPSSSGAAWRAQTDEDEKARAAVGATRYLNRLPWLGEKAAESQTLEWPRTGITDVDEAVTPEKVLEAFYELAGLINAGEPIGDTPGFAAAEARRLKAGSVEIENFRSLAVQRYPQIVLDLLRDYLSSGASLDGGSYATGTAKKSQFRRGYGLTHGF